ncbi:MAG: diguanylate cyclase (GGDEF)-like protein [Methylophagaceae bacterium]|jgi:diguanylate cyclase (GGDEF)-like protein
MTVVSNFGLELNTELPKYLQAGPVTGTDIATLLDAKIVVAGAKISDIAFMRTMLEISGFTDITVANSGKGVLKALREGIEQDICDIDLVVLDSSLDDMTARELRSVMNQFDEWQLIPIISLTQESQWDHSKALTDLGHGVTSLQYHPLTAESFPPSVMTALAVKRERDKAYQRQADLQEEVSTLKVMEARLKFSIDHDELTGLSNRRKLEQSLEMSLIQSRNFNINSVLMYIDLDRFKVLNDTEGHSAGDALLIQIANTLRRLFSIKDTLVRIGSDEFAVLIDNIQTPMALKKAEEIRAELDGYHFEHMGNEYHLSASIGIKLISADNELISGDILSHANQACYTAKERGRNRVHVHNPSDTEMHNLRHNVQWAPRIRAALQQEKFLLEFQPIHAVATNSISHYECLIRMRGEDGVIFSPNEFIPVAEKMGLVEQIDLWVINHVFDLMCTLPNDISFNINLSANIFLDNQLYPLVERKLRETGVNPGRIVFEITETSAVLNFEQTKAMVNKLRSLGCSFALDDFGAGFNSYSYLKHFPVEMLKIDGAFITDLETDEVDQILVKSMIDVAHQLGKKTVAEFVERQSTMDLLKTFGIDYIQGYLVGRPQVSLLNS